QLNFDTQNDIRTGRVTSMTTDAKQGAHPLFTNFSAYGQDSWKVSPHITITYGLRWEINPPPGEADNKSPVVVSGLDNPATATLAQPGSPLYHTTYRNFAPRLGVAHQLLQTSGREMSFRGGFGVFYGLGNDTVTNAFIGYPFFARVTQPNVPLPIPASQN